MMGKYYLQHKDSTMVVDRSNLNAAIEYFTEKLAIKQGGGKFIFDITYSEIGFGHIKSGHVKIRGDVNEDKLE